MKMLKKLFGRLTAHDTPPPVRPEPAPQPEEVQDPRYAYRREQADFRRRAKAVTMFWTGSTYRRTEPKAKRPGRARRTRLAQERAA